MHQEPFYLFCLIATCKDMQSTISRDVMYMIVPRGRHNILVSHCCTQLFLISYFFSLQTNVLKRVSTIAHINQRQILKSQDFSVDKQLFASLFQAILQHAHSNAFTSLIGDLSHVMSHFFQIQKRFTRGIATGAKKCGEFLQCCGIYRRNVKIS